MAARVRDHDWAATPLGPIDQWSAELRIAASFVIENSFPSALVWGPDLITIYNDGFLAILGDKTDALGRSFSHIWSEAWEEIGPIAKRAMAGQSTFIEDYRLVIDRKGEPEEAFFTFSYSPVRGPDGTVLGMIDTVIETTAEVRSRSALRESETRHRLIVESWAQAVWETDPEGVVVADSPSWRAYTGQTLEEWLGYGWLDAIHPDDRAYAERQWREAMALRTLVDAEFRLRSPDGGWRWTNIRAAPVLDERGEIAKWAGINIDIDARKRAEEALRESEERRELALEATQLGTFVWHIEEDRGEADARMLALFDQPSDGGLSLRTALATMIHPDDGSRYAAAFAEALRPESMGRLQADIRVRRADGSWRWLEIAGRVSFGQDGQPLRMAGTALDITNRKAIETGLRRSEGRLRALFETIDEGFSEMQVILDDKGHVVDWLHLSLNANFSRVTGIPDITGRLASEVFPNLEGEWFRRMDMAYRTGEPQRFETELAELGRWFDNYITRLGGEDDTRMFGVFADITERKSAEQTLRESEERQAFLLKLSDTLRGELDEGRIEQVALEMLAEKLSADRAYITTSDYCKGETVVPAEVQRVELPRLTGVFLHSDWPESAHRVNEGTIVVTNAGEDPNLSEHNRRSFETTRIGALIGVGLRRGTSDIFWTLAAATAEPRSWTPRSFSLRRRPNGFCRRLSARARKQLCAIARSVRRSC